MKIEKVVETFYASNEGRYATAYDIRPEFLLKHGDLLYPKITLRGEPCCRIMHIHNKKDGNKFELYNEYDARTKFASLSPDEEVETLIYQLQTLGRI